MENDQISENQQSTKAKQASQLEPEHDTAQPQLVYPFPG